VTKQLRYTNEYNRNTYDECSEEEKWMLGRVDKICGQKHLKWKYFPVTNKLFIYSNISTWITKLITVNYSLYHHNQIQAPKAYFECNFHKQGYEFSSIEEVIKYIARHDKNKYKRAQKRLYNSPLERAFREINR
jgi:hypothetical protein